jgi:S-adenosylmethionine synthetase
MELGRSGRSMMMMMMTSASASGGDGGVAQRGSATYGVIDSDRQILQH